MKKNNSSPKEAELRSLVLDQTLEQIFWKDLDGKYLGCNSAFATSMGLISPSDIAGKTDRDLMGSETSERYDLIDSQVIKNNKPVSTTLREYDPDGVERWTETTRSPLLDSTGTFIGIVGISRDVTASKLSEHALRESEDLSRAITDHAPIGISVRDRHGNLLLLNESWKRIWNVDNETAEQNLQKKRKILQFDKTDSYLGTHIDEVLKIYSDGGELFIPEIEINHTREGTAKWISHHFYAIKNDENKVDKVVILTQDITRQKYSEQALSQRDAEYSSLSSNVPVGVFRAEWRKRGRFISANPALLKMFKYDSMDSMLNTRVSRIVRDRDEIRNVLGIISNEGGINDYEIELIRMDGTTFWGALSTRLIHYGGETGEVFLDGIVSDVTERESSSEQLRESLDQLKRTISGTVMAMSLLVDMKDPYTAGHQYRVADLSCEIASKLGFPSERIEGLRISGILHDIGKMCVPTEILTKPGAIGINEINLIRSHSEAGYDILKNIEFPWPVSEIVLQHHERLDGSGYPRGLKDRDICMESRILAVADVVEAMATRRPYRPARGIHLALKEVTVHSGTKFDRKVVEACVKLFMEEGYRFSDHISLDSNLSP